jgi:hypothetical protein
MGGVRRSGSCITGARHLIGVGPRSLTRTPPGPLAAHERWRRLVSVSGQTGTADHRFLDP